MNYFKTLIISIFTVSCALPAAAQFANSGNNAASSATPRRTVTISPYDRVSVSYVNTKLANDAKGADDISLNGVGLDYIHGFSLSKSFPLYLETGVKATLSFFSLKIANGIISGMTMLMTKITRQLSRPFLLRFL